MSLERELSARSGAQCELCGAKEQLSTYEVKPVQRGGGINDYIYACKTCQDQIEGEADMDVNHWRCLNDSMWSEEPVVQVVAWRMLTRLKAEGWPQDLLDMMYLDEHTQEWAKASGEGQEDDSIKHIDANGVLLQTGDSVVLVKDLVVKGANFTAKRGTAVRRITLDRDNPKYIEGKVNGQQIVLLTDYVKKTK